LISGEDLPLGWVWDCVGIFIDKMIGGASPKQDDYIENGILALNKGDIKTRGKLVIKKTPNRVPESFVLKNNNKLIGNGDIVVTLRDLSQKADFLGLVAKYSHSEKALITQGMYRLNISASCCKNYLVHYSNSPVYRGQVKTEKVGATQVHLRNDQFKNLRIPLAPQNEQTHIANKLDELLAQVDTIKARVDAIPKIIKRFRQSVLAAAVSGKLTEEWRKNNNPNTSKEGLLANVLDSRRKRWEEEQFKKFDRKGEAPKNVGWKNKYKNPLNDYLDEYDTTLIKSAPKEWLVSNLDTVSILVTGKTPSTINEDNWGGETPFISPSQISPDGSILVPERFVSNTGASNTPILPMDSILIVCIGTIGKVGLLDKEAAFNQQINAMIPVEGMDSRFLFYWSKTLHTWLNKTSSAVVNAAIINKSRLSSAPCPVPSFEEQKQIVHQVENFFVFADQIEQRVKDAQTRINHLTQSILAKAFRGELVPQDPNDEPAEKLLGRIQAERAEIEKLTKAAKSPVKKR
jgi:type I restriction enzyme S subunit